MIFLFAFLTCTFAEERNTTKFEDIVVTATRTEKTVESAPGSVKVVTKEDMEKKNVRTVDSALSTVPGVFNRRQSQMDTLAAVALRGIPDQKRTLVMRDGVPLNNAYTGDVQFGGMSLDDLERVEVVQGPFSSLYGGYAMGGVVNIISRLPEKREFTVKGGYGTSWHRGESLDDLEKYYLSYGDKLTDKLRLLVSYGYTATNGYPKELNVQLSKPTAGITGWSDTTNNQGVTRYLIGDKGDNRWWDDTINIKLGYDFSRLSKLRASFMRTRYEYNYDEPHTYLRNAAGQPVYSYGTVRENSFANGFGARETNLYHVDFETGIGVTKTKLSFGFNDQVKNWYTTPGTDTSTTLQGGPGKLSQSPNQNIYTELQSTFPLFEKHVVTLGGSYKHGRANTEEYNLSNWKDEDTTTTLSYNSGGKDDVYALFIQDEIVLSPHLTAYIGLRRDWWRVYDGYANQFGSGAFRKIYDSKRSSAFSPKMAIVYKPFEVTTLKIAAGKAFRPPTVYELYRTWVGSTGTTYNGNPELKPEKVRSWDIGFNQGLWKGASIGATYFENYLKDLIYRKTVSANRQDYINAGKAESKGITLEAEQRFDTWLRIFGNFTYTDARIKENIANPATEGKRLTQMPEKMFNVGAESTLGKWTASIIGRYVSKRYSNDENKDTVDGVYTSYDSRFTTDAKVSYRVHKNATISFSVDNVFNESYFDYYKAPGRLWFGELELRL